MRKQTILILPLVVTMVSVAGIHGFWWLESALAQNASMGSNTTSGTNMGNSTMSGNMTSGNATMSNTSGNSAKMHLEEGIKALQAGDKDSAMTHLSAAQAAMSGASSNAMMHFEEGMKALQAGDTNGAITHLTAADQALG